VIHAAMLLGSGLVMLVWRPCRDAEGRAPRSAIIMLLAAAVAVWIGSFGMVVGIVTGEVGAPVAGCGALWRSLVAGDLGWRQLALLAGWAVALPLRAVVAVGGAVGTTARIRAHLQSLGTGLDGHEQVIIVPGLGTPAVTVGVWRPVIAVDASFWADASHIERAVVLVHEQAHQRGRHSVIDSAARYLTAPLPRATAIYDCIRRHLEALADDAAVRRHDRRTVGVALGRIALASYPPRGLGASGAAVWRVQRLVQPSVRPSWRDRLVLSVSGLAIVLGLVVVTGDIAAALGPLAVSTFCPL
jgi:hypothetical protein